jgi:cytochrome P450
VPRDATTDLDDLLGDEAINRPATFCARLREEAPVHFNPKWNGWIVSTYEDVAAGFRNHLQLSSDRLAGPWGNESDDAALGSAHTQLHTTLSNFFAWHDPPTHTRIRSLVNRAFTPRSVDLLRPRVEDLLVELVEELPVGRPFDFLGDFAFHLPVIVISEYLGVPSEARDDVKVWSEDLAGVIFVRGDDHDRVARADAAVRNLTALLEPIVEARRSEPRDDLISGMVRARNDDDDGDALTTDEIIANAILMLFAGHETTTNLLANGVVAFWENPDQWEMLRAQPDLVPTAVEEVLRFDGPIRAMARWAKTPLDIGHTHVDEGQRVLLMQWAANRDPLAFEDPDAFDITRDPNRHVAFGHGIHMCLGAPLARMEAREAFGFLARRFDRISVAQDDLTYNRTIVSRSLESLQVVLEVD